MENQSKQTLEELRVVSFTTSLDRDEQEHVRGGSDNETPTYGTTSIPIFC